MKRDFHTQLKLLREERQLSLEDLALKARVSVSRLLAFEAGEEVPSTQTILNLSNALEVPASNLLDGAESAQ